MGDMLEKWVAEHTGNEGDTVAYVTQHEPDAVEEQAADDADLVRAVIRAIKRDPKLHAELRMALEHRI